jgi:HCOMODA/2-hydroxy-3-carboxy-muconic semialdehyde decarboxylase
MSLIEDLVISYRTLAAEGVIDAYGHVSVRSDRNPNRYLMARQLAPELVTEGDILEFDLDSNPIDPRDRKFYNERYIHGEIFKARPEVMAVVHNHAPAVVPFSCTTRSSLKPIYHMSAFIGLGVPNWDIRETQKGTDMLVRTPFLGQSLAKKLGKYPAVLMRGHGSTCVGENLQRAVGRSVYLEQNARMQFQAMMLAGPKGKVNYMDAKEVAANVSWQNYDRSWNLWRTRALAKLKSEKARPVTGD